MNLKSKKPTLLLVDIQKAFLDVDYPGFKPVPIKALFTFFVSISSLSNGVT